MNDDSSELYDIFNGPLPENDEQRATLTRELRYAKGFSLVFALCNSADERDRQMKALREEVPELRIQDVPVREEIPHLSYLLRTVLEAPLPDAVFVYGLENWIRSDSKPRTIPFLLNLNAARNHFIKDCPCPLVFWMPEYMLSQIIGSAPDFASVRSGIYIFTPSNADDLSSAVTIQSLGFSAVSGLALEDKQQRLNELKMLLEQLRELPVDLHNRLDETYLISQIAQLYFSIGHFQKAEQLYLEALSSLTDVLGKEHLDTAAAMQDLATISLKQGNFSGADALYLESLSIKIKLRGRENSETLETVNALAQSYSLQGKYTEAEKMYLEVVDLNDKILGHNHPDTAMTLHDLAQLYSRRRKYELAEPLYQDALAIELKTIGKEHQLTAVTLHDLALLYFHLGRYAEAEPLANESLAILRRLLPTDHPDIAIVENTLDVIHRSASGLT